MSDGSIRKKHGLISQLGSSVAQLLSIVGFRKLSLNKLMKAYLILVGFWGTLAWVFLLCTGQYSVELFDIVLLLWSISIILTGLVVAIVAFYYIMCTTYARNVKFIRLQEEYVSRSQSTGLTYEEFLGELVTYLYINMSLSDFNYVIDIKQGTNYFYILNHIVYTYAKRDKEAILADIVAEENRMLARQKEIEYGKM